VVDEDDLGVVGVRDRLQLLGLAAAEEVARVGTVTPPGDRRDRDRAGGDRQLRELVQVLRVDLGSQPQAHQYGALTSPWALEHSGFP